MDWNTDTTNILKFYKNLLGIIGLWVLNEKNVFSRIRWFLSTMVEVSYALSHFYYIFIIICNLTYLRYLHTCVY